MNYFGILKSQKFGPVLIAEFAERELHGDEQFFSRQPLDVVAIISTNDQVVANGGFHAVDVAIHNHDEPPAFPLETKVPVSGVLAPASGFPTFLVIGQDGALQTIDDINQVIIVDHNVQGAQNHWGETIDLFGQQTDEVGGGDLMGDGFGKARTLLDKAHSRLQAFEDRCKTIPFIDEVAWSIETESYGPVRLKAWGIAEGISRDALLQALQSYIDTHLIANGQRQALVDEKVRLEKRLAEISRVLKD